MGVAIDSLDEGATQTVNGEGSRAPQRFAAGDVSVDLGLRRGAEADGGRADPLGDGPIDGAHQEVPRVQGAGAPAHCPPTLAGVGGVDGLADHTAVNLQHRVAAHDHLGILRVGGGCDVERLGSSQGLYLLSGARGCQPRGSAPLGQLVKYGLLVDGGGSHQRFDAGGSQGGQAAG